MKKTTLLTATTCFAASFLMAQAGPNEEVANAITKLAEKANYSWTTTTKRPEPAGGAEGDARRGGPGTSSGKTANGLILTTLTMGDRSFEMLRKGEKSASKRDGVWTVREPRPAGDAGAGGQGDDQRGNRGRGGFGGGFGGASSLPDARATELLSKVGELKQDGDVYAGDLTEEGAKSLMSFGGGRRGGGGGDNAQRPEPTGAKGSAKFWIKEGVLVKYETSLTGKISFNGTDRDLSRTTTTEFTDIGNTEISVPADIVEKLSAK